MNNEINQILEKSQLGDEVILKLGDVEQNRIASTALTKHARYYLDIISHDLDRKIYDNEAFKNAVKDLAISNPKARIRLLINNSDAIIAHGHRLVELARRLTSFIDIRIQGDNFKEFNEAWLIVDAKAWIRRPFADQYAAEVDYSAARQLRETCTTFDTMWNEASHDPNLRCLSI